MTSQTPTPSKTPTKTRLIINNLSSCTTQEALSVVQSVINTDYISIGDRDYCCISTITSPKIKVNQGDSFTIQDDPQGSLVFN